MTHTMLTLADYVHRIDPFVIEFADGVGIRWYGLAYVVGFLAAFLLVRLMARRRLSPLEPDRVPDFVLAVAIGVIVGGRLGYCVFYQPELLTDFSTQFPFWGVLAIARGGMASHGAVVGMILAAGWYARHANQPTAHLFDLAAFTTPVGIFFGRIANFINGELLGRPAPDWLPWAVKFPQEVREWPRWSPEKLATPEFERVARMVHELYGETAQSTDVLLHRVAIAARENDQVAAALEPLLTARHPSQIYAALLEGLLVFLVLAFIWRLPRKPGIIAGAALVTYPVVRIFSEMFRMPDPHIGFQWLGLTRGQWLSALMLVVGVACLAHWLRLDREPLGGWARRTPTRKSEPE